MLTRQEIQTINPHTEKDWLSIAVREVTEGPGVCVIDNILPQDVLDLTREKIHTVKTHVERDLSWERLSELGEVGILRLMMCYDPHFFSFLEIPQLLAFVDATVSPTAILHTQNGIILPPVGDTSLGKQFSNRLHMDFPRTLNGYLASVNVFFAISAFNAENGGTLVVPCSQQTGVKPEEEPVSVECAPGSMFVFDSTLWHCSGENRSNGERIGINHQFTRSFFKPQMDFVRAIGEDVIQSLPDRSQQLLGYYTRVPVTLDEYYRSGDERLYRPGQG